MKTDASSEWHRLFSAALNDQLSDAERAQLAAVLKSSAEARQLWFLYQDNECSLAELKPRSQMKSPRTGFPLLSWRPLTAAAAGIVFGMFCTSVVLGYVVPRTMERVRTVFSESFESGVTKTVPGLPHETSRWTGDEAEVVAAVPVGGAHGGVKMLRFVRATYPGENSPRSQWGDVYRLVDVRGMAGEGRTMARLSASFTQGAVTGDEWFACRVAAFALDQDLSTLPSPLDLAWVQQNNSATGSRRGVLKGTGSWQNVSVEVPITSETRYVMLHLAMVQEQPPLKSGAVQFRAHFMDDVKLEIVSDR